MNPWIKRLFLLLSVGGGFCGARHVSYYFHDLRYNPFGWSHVGTALSVGIFLYGIFSGLKLAENEAQGLKLLRWFFGIQIPAISSPIILYQVVSGVELTFSWSFVRDISVFGRIGSDAALQIFSDADWLFGINTAAVVLYIWTSYLLRRK